MQGRTWALRTYRLFPNELKHYDLSLLHFQYMYVDLFTVFYGKQLNVDNETSFNTPSNVPVKVVNTGAVVHSIDSQSETFREHAFCSIFQSDRIQPPSNNLWWKFRVNSFQANSKFVNFTYRVHNK